jgi:hypothetical protein
MDAAGKPKHVNPARIRTRAGGINEMARFYGQMADEYHDNISKMEYACLLCLEFRQLNTDTCSKRLCAAELEDMECTYNGDTYVLSDGSELYKGDAMTHNVKKQLQQCCIQFNLDAGMPYDECLLRCPGVQRARMAMAPANGITALEIAEDRRSRPIYSHRIMSKECEEFTSLNLKIRKWEHVLGYKDICKAAAGLMTDSREARTKFMNAQLRLVWKLFQHSQVAPKMAESLKLDVDHSEGWTYREAIDELMRVSCPFERMVDLFADCVDTAAPAQRSLMDNMTQSRLTAIESNHSAASIQHTRRPPRLGQRMVLPVGAVMGNDDVEDDLDDSEDDSNDDPRSGGGMAMVAESRIGMATPAAMNVGSRGGVAAPAAQPTLECHAVSQAKALIFSERYAGLIKDLPIHLMDAEGDIYLSTKATPYAIKMYDEDQAAGRSGQGSKNERDTSLRTCKHCPYDGTGAPRTHSSGVCESDEKNGMTAADRISITTFESLARICMTTQRNDDSGPYCAKGCFSAENMDAERKRLIDKSKRAVQFSDDQVARALRRRCCACMQAQDRIYIPMMIRQLQNSSTTQFAKEEAAMALLQIQIKLHTHKQNAKYRQTIAMIDEGWHEDDRASPQLQMTACYVKMRHTQRGCAMPSVIHARDDPDSPYEPDFNDASKDADPAALHAFAVEIKQVNMVVAGILAMTANGDDSE